MAQPSGPFHRPPPPRSRRYRHPCHTYAHARTCARTYAYTNANASQDIRGHAKRSIRRATARAKRQPTWNIGTCNARIADWYVV